MEDKKVAICTGFSGQTSPFLAKLLLNRGYKVYGIVRRNSHPNLDFVDELGLQDVEMMEGDLCDSISMDRIVSRIKPDEFYNCGAQSHVGSSFNQPLYTADVDALGVLRILESIRFHSPETRFYQASSSEMFGGTAPPQNEQSHFLPNSPYAAAKVFAHHMVRIYREAYGIFACCGICHNHTSPRRGVTFVTRKITTYLAKYINNRVDIPLELGNLDSRRDWTSALDIAEAIYLVVNHTHPDDYVIGSGESHSVREFLEIALKYAGINFIKRGAAVDEKYIDTNTGKTIVQINPTFYRPLEVDALCADITKVQKVLGWQPKMGFSDIVKWILDADIKCIKQKLALQEA